MSLTNLESVGLPTQLVQSFDNSTFDEVLLVFSELMVRIQELSMHVEARKLATRLQPTKLKSFLACGAREPSMHTPTNE